MNAFEEMQVKRLVTQISHDVSSSLAHYIENTNNQSNDVISAQAKAIVRGYIDDITQKTNTRIDSWTANRIVIKPNKKFVQVFYVNTNNGKHQSIAVVRGLRKANVLRKRALRNLDSVILMDLYYKPSAPVSYINIKLNLERN